MADYAVDSTSEATTMKQDAKDGRPRRSLWNAWIEPVRSEIRSESFHVAVVGEFVATFLFVLLTTTVASRAGEGGFPFQTTVSLSFGFAIALGAHNFGEISGGHFNPAVTFASFLTLRISVLRAALYIAAQLLGSVLASLLLYSLLPVSVRNESSLGANTLSPLYSEGQGFGWELFATFFFVFTILCTVDNPRGGGFKALAIGLAGTVAHLALVPITGCGINPARSFGPNVMAEALTAESGYLSGAYWIYWAGPLVGSAAAALLYDNFFSLPARQCFRGRSDGDTYADP